eukprot:gnl/TRDRNA2_/TRDRNA2_194509_c0_seq1.p1 gnl/TRDRNA2_/TRDRNA2_194509_c0~~gnl/TRDRNA2_/TRDRNA2_194509_c0_seq1.p1  ORF type:complete len:227 (-),score=33.44 gnl/TRDRNA2_/TRDRNA2_194509_c0_seq1:93-773(-)
MMVAVCFRWAVLVCSSVLSLAWLEDDWSSIGGKMGTTYMVKRKGIGDERVSVDDEVVLHMVGWTVSPRKEFFNSRTQARPLPKGENVIAWRTDDSIQPKVEKRGRDVGVKGTMIKGIEFGVRGMRCGEVRLLRVPAAEAYGSQGYKGETPIPPDTDLEYEIELLDIENKEKPSGWKKFRETHGIPKKPPQGWRKAPPPPDPDLEDYDDDYDDVAAPPPDVVVHDEV